MHISYQPLWDTLKERGMRKEDLRLCRRSDHQYDCQHGQGKAYQYGNTTAYLQSIELWNFECD